MRVSQARNMEWVPDWTPISRIRATIPHYRDTVVFTNETLEEKTQQQPRGASGGKEDGAN